MTLTVTEAIKCVDFLADFLNPAESEIRLISELDVFVVNFYLNFV